MAQQKGMKRAAKVQKRNQQTARAKYKANVKRLTSGHQTGHTHDHDHAGHDHDHEHGHEGHDHK